MTNIHKIIIVSVLFLTIFAATKAIAGKTVTITDLKGRSFCIDLPVKKIVALTTDSLEVIRALGAKELVVGISNDILTEGLFWADLKDRAVIGSCFDPHYELIATLNPDIVICYDRWPGPEMEKKLTPFGIKVVRLDFYKIKTLEKEVEILGRILKKEEEARQLINWHREKLNLISMKLKDIGNPPDVYVESYSEYHAAGQGSGGHEMCVLAGGHNIASGSSIAYPEITPEWVLANNPHLIIKAATLTNSYGMSDPGHFKRVREKIMLRPAWDNIHAVQKEKIYVIASDIWTGPRAVIGVAHMAKWFYPDIFKDFEPEKLHREYMEKFQGVKYQGVYVYPQ